MSGTILLVDDSQDDIFGFKWAMKEAKLSNPLRVVTDGEIAVDYLSGVGQYADRTQFPMPTHVFLDIKMPRMSGHEVLAWMKTQPDLTSIPVAMLSGSDETADHNIATSNGADAYMVKPPTVAELTLYLQRVAALNPPPQNG